MNNPGYLHPLYAQSLIEFGEPLELPDSKGWILKRSIPGSSQFDGMGCYPIFSCQDWSGLEKDLDRLGSQLVSLSLVTDPFGRYTQKDLTKCFKDIARPFKQHFIVDLGRPLESFIDPHHRRNAKKALDALTTVEQCVNAEDYLDDWVQLYGHLIKRHQIKGIAAFSHNSFAGQFKVPGMVAFRAAFNGETVGMLLWYIQEKIGYYHLGAYSPRGYEMGASFALFWVAIKSFAESGLQWLSIGAGAGADNDGENGLTRYKKGWSTGTRTAYFCGRILDQKKYQEVLETKGGPPTKFFPAYRFGEF